MSRRDVSIGLSEQKRRKFVVVVDGNPETEMALLFAAKRSQNTQGDLLLLYIIEPPGFGHWVNVGKIMEQESQSIAQDHVNRARERVYNFCGVTAETVILNGEKVKEIIDHIEKDESIAVLILAAAAGKNSAGPLITKIVKEYVGTFPVPITIVPGDLTEEQIERLA